MNKKTIMACRPLLKAQRNIIVNDLEAFCERFQEIWSNQKVYCQTDNKVLHRAVADFRNYIQQLRAPALARSQHNGVKHLRQ